MPDADLDTFGDFLARLRRRAGFDTQAAALRALHERGHRYTAASMCRWEQGAISLQALAQLVALYEADADEAARLFELVGDAHVEDTRDAPATIRPGDAA